jgi:hypothetical protein
MQGNLLPESEQTPDSNQRLTEHIAEYALPVSGRFALVRWHRIVSSGALLTPVMRPQDVSRSPCTDELPAVPGGVISASGPGSGEIGGDALAGRWDATMGTLAWPEGDGAAVTVVDQRRAASVAVGNLVRGHWRPVNADPGLRCGQSGSRPVSWLASSPEALGLAEVV